MSVDDDDVSVRLEPYKPSSPAQLQPGSGIIISVELSIFPQPTSSPHTHLTQPSSVGVTTPRREDVSSSALSV